MRYTFSVNRFWLATEVLLKRMPDIRFRIDFGDELHVGPGKIALLESIDELGSLNMAANAVGLSYRRAWLLLDSLNKTFDRPVVESRMGGKHGGGSSVTEFGKILIRSYRDMERKISALGADCLKPVLPYLFRTAPTDSISRHRLARKLVRPKPRKPRDH